MSEIQLVIFRLDREEYGVNIMEVQEIGEYQKPIKVPNAPDFIEGIINLRGDVIPIINLHKRLNIPQNEIGDLTRLVVINIGDKRVGFVVDDASEVMTISDEYIEEAPPMVAGTDRKYISGVGKIESKIFIILDLNKLFSDDEHEELKAIDV